MTVNTLNRPLGEALAQAVADPALGRWSPVVAGWLASAPGQACVAAIEARQRGGAIVYPGDVLRALKLTPLESVRVLILGQDPYHGPGQAQGLAFSVPDGHRLPPSLRHILQEVRRDIGVLNPEVQGGDLSAWARQGVLLLNSSLTVEDGSPGAHSRLGWSGLIERLLNAVVAETSQPGRALAVLLWGAHAQAWAPVVQSGGSASASLVLNCNHPSPLSARRGPAPFLGCGHFSRARDFLAQRMRDQPPLRW